MAKVKVKTTKSNENKQKLLEILSSNDIYVTRIIPINDGYNILTINENELDMIFNGTNNKTLKDHDLNPVIPLQLKANRTILIFKVDNHIYQNTEAEIKNEIQDKNEWATQIHQIYKIPNSNTRKVTFITTAMAKKTQDAGLKLFSMRIPPRDIKQDVFHEINTCLKCYA